MSSAEWHRAAIVAAAQNRARDLANTPANDLTPTALGEYAGSWPRVTPPVADRARRGGDPGAGHGAFAAVAQGTRRTRG